MEAVAKMRNIPMSARKMRLVVDLIRGKSIDDALNILRFTKNEAAEWCEKTLLSAIANWEQKTDMTLNADDYELYIKEIFSDEGSFLKRYRPAPHGRAHRIRKRTNHITLVVENWLPIDEEALEDVEYVEEIEEFEEE
ncbi:MAG: 50S ribosomal protein L22 [Christiangramia sp.]|nr:50S ribosomal protein L22 [Christiangramia sp.]